MKIGGMAVSSEEPLHRKLPLFSLYVGLCPKEAEVVGPFEESRVVGGPKNR
jgi:hypothetical protein